MLTEIRPGLVPSTFDDESAGVDAPLSGVSLDSVVRRGKQVFREATLFTHRGLSGPAVLEISSYWQQRTDQPEPAPKPRCRRVLAGAQRRTGRKPGWPACWRRCCRRGLPRLWRPIPAGGWRTCPIAGSAALAGRLSVWSVTPSGTEGFAKAEVTCGGVDTRDLSSQTMAQCRSRVFVIGEAVDVTGWLGGYNFQWAWASGWCAGEAV